MSNDDKSKTPEYQHEILENYNIQELHAPIMREQSEPRDGHEPIPPAFAPLFGVLIFWAGFFFAGKYGKFDPNVLSESAMPSRGGDAAEKEPTPLERGGRIFSGTCASCHNGDGAGAACPPLAKSEWVQSKPPGVPIRIILNGLTGPITVQGKPYNLNMKIDPPPSKDIAAVVTFIRQAWGNASGEPKEVTPEFVDAVRKKVGTRGPWTASELEGIDDSDIVVAAPPDKDKPPEKK